MLQFDAAGCAGDGLVGRGRRKFLLLHHTEADMIEMSPGVFLVQRIRDIGQNHGAVYRTRCRFRNAFSIYPDIRATQEDA